MGPYTFGKRCRFVGLKKRNDSFAQMANAGSYEACCVYQYFVGELKTYYGLKETGSASRKFPI